MKNMAVIDLGSNSIRLVIWQILENNSHRVIYKTKDMVRLSEGLNKDKMLKPSAMSQALSSLKMFSNIIKTKCVFKTYVIATAAMRTAYNAEMFLNLIKAETGLEVQIISGLEEASYVYYGNMNTLSLNDCILIDTGGASTEVILVKDRKIVNSESIPVGAVTLYEQFMYDQKPDVIPSKRTLQLMYDHVYGLFESLTWLRNQKCIPIIGLGGSIRSLGKIHQLRCNYPLKILHNYNIHSSSVCDTIRLIESLSFKKRLEFLKLDKKRADTIVGGLTPLKSIIKLTRSQNVVISESGLREGVFYNHILGKNHIINDVLAYNANNILNLYDQDIKHCRWVQSFCEVIFDELKSVHMVDEYYKKVLSCAAMLHDIGLAIDYENHDKHGFYMLLSTRFYGLTHKELVLCALLISMHDLNEFKENWKKYEGMINEYDYISLKKLSLFIKLAESLDKIRNCFTKKIEFVVNGNTVKILLTGEKVEHNLDFTDNKIQKTFLKTFGRSLELILC